MHKKISFCLLITQTILNAGLIEYLFYPTPTPQQTQPSSSVTSIPAGTSAPIQVIVNNHNTPHMDNSAHMHSTQSMQTHVTLTHFISMIQEHPLYKDAPETYATFKTWAYDHRYRIAAIGAGIGYASLAAKSLRAQQYLSHRGSWCQWKKHLSMEELQEYDHKELVQNLIQDIQMRHIDTFHPTDFITPCVRFINTIEIESHHIHYLIMLSAVSMKLKRIFFITNETLEKAKLYKQRLSFIKHLFVSWAASYNVGQAIPGNGFTLSSQATHLSHQT